MSSDNAPKPIPSENQFSVTDFLSVCASHWVTFLCSFLIFLCIGLLYVERKIPMYARSTQVLIQDQDMGGSAAIEMAGALSSFSFLGSNTQVNNELIAMKSPAVLSEVVNRLGLTMNYAQRIELLHRTPLYGTDLPINAQFLDLGPQDAAGFRIYVQPNGSYSIDKFYTIDTKVRKHDFEATGRFNQVIKTPAGRLKITPNPVYSGKIDETLDIKVAKGGLTDIVADLSDRLSAELVNDEAEVVELAIEDACPDRAVDILNTVLAVYREQWFDDKKEVSSATTKFISERLANLEKELGVIDSDIFSYQAAHSMPDLKTAAEIYMTEAAKHDSEIMEIQNRLAMTSYVRDYVLDPKNKYQVLPINTGIESPQLEIEIGNYNSMLLARNSIASNSSDANPLVEDYDSRLKGLRESVLRSINVNIAQLKASLSNMSKQQKIANAKISDTPNQANYLISIERKQEVMSQLYLFLLQKREETQLSQAFSSNHLRIIAPPNGPIKPVSPRKVITVALFIILGIAIPAAYYYLAVASDSKINSGKDLRKADIPFLGGIPYIGKKKGYSLIQKLLGKKKSKKDEEPLVVVDRDNSDAVNNAFRLVRTNLEFMSDPDTSSMVLAVTSINPGAGDAFITYNLGMTFALKGKRVLLIEGDLRNPALSAYVGNPAEGLSSYLSGKTSDWRRLIRSNAGAPDVLPLGTIPPNPTDLLDTERFKSLICETELDYDYILIDCPPLNVVADTMIIARYVDRTLLVIPAGEMDKSELNVIEEMTGSKKFNNISVIINGEHGS